MDFKLDIQLSSWELPSPSPWGVPSPFPWVSYPISSSFSSFVLVQHNIPQLPKKLFGEINALSLKMSCHGIWLILEWVVISSPGDLPDPEIKPVVSCTEDRQTPYYLSHQESSDWEFWECGWSFPVSGEGAYFPKHAVILFSIFPTENIPIISISYSFLQSHHNQGDLNLHFA